MIYLSSASVHGQSPVPGTDETSPLQSRQPIPYNRSKIEAERRLSRARSSGAVELVILRPGIVYGPRMEAFLNVHRVTYWIWAGVVLVMIGVIAYRVQRASQPRQRPA